jgi:hypothetical protein
LSLLSNSHDSLAATLVEGCILPVVVDLDLGRGFTPSSVRAAKTCLLEAQLIPTIAAFSIAVYFSKSSEALI